MKSLNLIILVFLLAQFTVKAQNLTVKETATEIIKSTVTFNSHKPTVELVFCLDATGSMSGLIHTAKEKIWDIVTVISQAEPSPNIKLGMIFYRDLTDDFVTKSYPLTENIDSIYAELLQINAAGGGDSPESVNQALNEAVAKMNWSGQKDVYRTVFLVGDCPPHMDYKQDIKYPVSCKLANKKGIVINTIKLGLQCPTAVTHFKAIANATNGEYMQLGQNAEDVVINTPYDDSIRYYSYKIDKSKIYYGSVKIQNSMNLKQKSALGLYKSSSGNAIASRAQYNMSKSGGKNFYGENELIQEIIANKIGLEDIKKEDLPKNMQRMNIPERKDYIANIKKQREENLSKLTHLSKLREGFIRIKEKENPEKNSFSVKVFEIIKKQAATKGIKFIK